MGADDSVRLERRTPQARPLRLSILQDGSHVFSPNSSLTTSSGKSRIQPISSHFQLAFMTIPCKHPIVKIVSRDEDAEFVECQACGEIFDSTEFRDIAIEESTPAEEEN